MQLKEKLLKTGGEHVLNWASKADIIFAKDSNSMLYTWDVFKMGIWKFLKTTGADGSSNWNTANGQ